MLYNSEHYVVVQFDVPAPASDGLAGRSRGGGYEIVDKLAGREAFLCGELALRFRQDVQALIERQPSSDELEACVAHYAGLAQQPLVLH